MDILTIKYNKLINKILNYHYVFNHKMHLNIEWHAMMRFDDYNYDDVI